MKKKSASIPVVAILCVSALGLFMACGNSNTEPKTEDITGVTFEDKTVIYDGAEHEITVSGTLPEGVNVSYTDNKGTNAGTYNAKAILSGEGYNPLTLTATLTINKAEITGITFEGDTVTYDGVEHEINIDGTLPTGVNVSYANNKATNAGTYNVTATLSGANYVTKTLNATLTINKLTFTGITFEGATFQYDAAAHQIEIAGVLPQGSSVSYTGGENKNAATHSGSYTITATITNPNYETLILDATMKITGSEKERHITAIGNTVYFANALDNGMLYSYNGTEVTRVSSDIPAYFTAIGSDLYFRSGSLFFNSIKTLSGGKVDQISSDSAEYLCTDGTNLYFAVNGLTAEKSGIYKLNPKASEPAAVLLSQGKAKYLQCYNNTLYFADGSNGWKLSEISTSGGARTLVVDEKIDCLMAANGYLFYTVNNLLGDYIANYQIATGTTKKLTQDAGTNLCLVGNDLYYLNADFITSAVEGKGIYCVNAYPTANNQSAGTKVIGTENERYTSLALAGTGKLAYYTVSDQMLHVYTVSSKTDVKVLEGFVPPEYTPVSRGSKTLAYGNYIYFLDIYNDKALYSYDTITGTLSRVTSCKVSDFAILGDTLYFNGVSYLVNNDLYKVDLKLGGQAEKISTYDCNDIVTDGANLYYVEKNAAGARTAIHQIAADGTDTIMYSKGATGLTYYEGYIYFVDGNDLLKMPTEGFTENNTTTVKKGNFDTFVIDNGVVYFRETYGVGQKRLSRINIDGTGYTAMITKNTDPLAIRVVGDKVYYYTDTVLGISGIYSIDKDAQEDKEPTLILKRSDGYYAKDFTVSNGYIYFVNYYNNLGDSHFYRVNISTGKTDKLA